MGLREYRKKRRFEVTPEPPGEPAATDKRGRKLAYVVQKHQAKQLH